MPGGQELSGEDRERLLKQSKGLVLAQFHKRSDELPREDRNSYSAEDFWSEVQARAWGGRFRGSDSPEETEKMFRGWLMKIADNRFNDYLRDALRGPRRLPNRDSASKDRLAQAPGRGKTPSREARQHERVEKLQAVLARQPEPDRTILVLKFFEGLSVPEIAARVRLSAEAAQKRLERALVRLNRDLGGNASDYLSG